MSQSPFQKFVVKKKNSAVKEAFRQEKKKVKKERAAYFDKIKEEKYQARIAKKNALLNPQAPTSVKKVKTNSPVIK